MFIFRKKPVDLFTINKYLATVDDYNNDSSCLLQCFQQYINLKLYIVSYNYVICRLSLQMVPSVSLFLTNFTSCT